MGFGFFLLFALCLGACVFDGEEGKAKAKVGNSPSGKYHFLADDSSLSFTFDFRQDSIHTEKWNVLDSCVKNQTMGKYTLQSDSLCLHETRSRTSLDCAIDLSEWKPVSDFCWAMRNPGPSGFDLALDEDENGGINKWSNFRRK